MLLFCPIFFADFLLYCSFLHNPHSADAFRNTDALCNFRFRTKIARLLIDIICNRTWIYSKISIIISNPVFCKLVPVYLLVTI